MLFLGIGFLMAFLKQYGLSSVTLNFLCGIISVEWAALVIGFFNLHSKATIVAPNGTIVEESFKVGIFFSFNFFKGKQAFFNRKIETVGAFFPISLFFQGPGVAYINMMDSMVSSEFAAATAMISFGVIIGKASPLQMIVMSLVEIVLYVLNDYIGRFV